MANPKGPQPIALNRDGVSDGECRTARLSFLPSFTPHPHVQILASTMLVFVLSQGCAVVGVALLGSAASTATKTGVSYTLDSKAQKTFTAPADQVKASLLLALRDMAFPIESEQKVDDGEWIVAVANGREVQVELEAVTPKATKLRVVVRQGWFWKDRATAEEIIEQTARGVEGSVLAAWGRGEGAPSEPSRGFHLLSSGRLRLWDPSVALSKDEHISLLPESWRAKLPDAEGGPGLLDLGRAFRDPALRVAVKRELRPREPLQGQQGLGGQHQEAGPPMPLQGKGEPEGESGHPAMGPDGDLSPGEGLPETQDALPSTEGPVGITELLAALDRLDRGEAVVARRLEGEPLEGRLVEQADGAFAEDEGAVRQGPSKAVAPLLPRQEPESCSLDALDHP